MSTQAGIVSISQGAQRLSLLGARCPQCLSTVPSLSTFAENHRKIILEQLSSLQREKETKEETESIGWVGISAVWSWFSGNADTFWNRNFLWGSHALTLSFAINPDLLMGESALLGLKSVSEQCCPICISAPLTFSLLFVTAVITWTALAER